MAYKCNPRFAVVDPEDRVYSRCHCVALNSIPVYSNLALVRFRSLISINFEFECRSDSTAAPVLQRLAEERKPMGARNRAADGNQAQHQ